MARNDGIHRAVVRNAKISDGSVRKVQDHNEREKSTYSNQDIIPKRSLLNVHFKIPEDDYKKVFDKMVNNGEISVRGLRSDAVKFGELIFDVNSLYFYDHGGYDFAKRFYADAYNAAKVIVGGEEYILSAVMHADERNRALSELLRRDVYHYHMHVVYIPVIEKEVCWTRRCKNAELIGQVKERVMQVSMSRKWESNPVLGADGKPLKSKTGKVILKASYSVLQDKFFGHMCAAGYTDIERGEIGSTEEHLTTTQFKLMKEQERLIELQQNYIAEKENFDKALEDIQRKKLDIAHIDNIKTKPARLSNKVTIDKEDFDLLIAVAQKHIVQEKKESALQKALETANRLIAELKNLIANLERKLTEANKELAKFDFFKKENRDLNAENDRLRAKIRAYDEVISNHDLSPYFHRECEKEAVREDER
jgi:hypothetical protein